MAYVEQILVPTRSSGDIVDMDSLPACESADVRSAVEAAGVSRCEKKLLGETRMSFVARSGRTAAIVRPRPEMGFVSAGNGRNTAPPARGPGRRVRRSPGAPGSGGARRVGTVSGGL